MNGYRDFQTVRVRWERDLCFLQLYRPADNNTINDVMIQECTLILRECESRAKIVILEGGGQYFCQGADFAAIVQEKLPAQNFSPGPLYDLWLHLTQGSFVSVAHVRGAANAGGVGFAASCDLVLADQTARFSLSELLFGLMPACVLPFLVRKIGFQKAHAMTLLTRPVGVEDALTWGLVDAWEANSSALVRKYLSRLRCLNKNAITRYKRYMHSLNAFVEENRGNAIDANMQVFSDVENLNKITRYIRTGKMPWEED